MINEDFLRLNDHVKKQMSNDNYMCGPSEYFEDGIVTEQAFK